MFNNKQKATIVFSMLGEVYSDNILRKLPEDVFNKVQEEILPYVGQIPLPDDIDAFVLENIINDNDELEFDEEEKEVLEKPDILDLTGDQFLVEVDEDIVLDLLIKENPVFQSFILNFFSLDKRKNLEEKIVKQGITLIKDFQKTAALENVEDIVKKEFIDKLKAHIQKENKE